MATKLDLTNAEHIAELTKLARLGVLFKNDTLKFHFMLSIGREDDTITKTLQDRRMETAQEMHDITEQLDIS